MDTLKVKWTKRALSQFDSVNAWYGKNMGAKASERFSQDVRRAVGLVAQYPEIGMPDKVYASYRCFLVHPKYYLVYRFAKGILYVMAIRATQRKGI